MARLSEAMSYSTKSMLERKKKLAKPLVVADANRKPEEISATEALRILTQCENRTLELL